MKTTILVSGFPPEVIGGTEIATENIAKHLALHNHEVHVIYPTKNKSESYFRDGFYHHPVKISSLPLSFTYQALKLESQIKSDIVHAQGLFMGVPALVIKKLLGTPYLVYGRGSDVYTEYKNKALTLKAILNNADARIVLTEDMRREVQGITPHEILVIPNGVDCEKFNPHTHNNNHNILYVGGLREIKGVRHLIEAMLIIHKQYRDASLFIVGDGGDRDKLHMLVDRLELNKTVRFTNNLPKNLTGYVPNSLIPKYMQQSGIFVLPSLSEGFPVVLLEAMAAGLPIVATNVKGIPEIVEDGINGLLVHPKSSEELASKILKLLSNPEHRKIISQNNIEKAKQYSWDNVINRLEKVYGEINART